MTSVNPQRQQVLFIALDDLRKLGHSDTETIHFQADKLLVEFLRYEGYVAAMDIYERLPKWYA